MSTHPSPRLPLEEFHEWYDEEHIPNRLDHFKEFLSGARYRAIQGPGQSQVHSVNGSWLALYTVDSPAIFASGAYKDLRISRSAREKDVMTRIQRLTRRTGQVIGTLRGQEKTTGFKPGRPSGWVITHGIDTRVDGTATDKIISWAAHIEQEAAKYRGIEEGWARTLIVLVLESGISHFGVNVDADDQIKMPFFVVHGKEYKSSSILIISLKDMQSSRKENLLNRSASWSSNLPMVASSSGKEPYGSCIRHIHVLHTKTTECRLLDNIGYKPK